MKLAAACQAAQAAQLDLVLVSENSNPPVCRIMDFGKLLYEQKKKLKEQKIQISQKCYVCKRKTVLPL